RKLPNKQRRLLSKLPQNRQRPSKPNPNHAPRSLRLESPRSSRCEWRELLLLSGWTIQALLKRTNLANQVPRLPQHQSQLSEKLPDPRRRKLVLNKRSHRADQLRDLRSRNRTAPCGQL